MLFHTDMGFSEKEVADRGAPWAVVGISLKPVSTKAKSGAAEEEEEEEEECSTTPGGKEARIPEKLPCPPAPKKRKPPVRCRVISGEDFFSPPDLETVFLRRPERVK